MPIAQVIDVPRLRRNVQAAPERSHFACSTSQAMARAYAQFLNLPAGG